MFRDAFQCRLDLIYGWRQCSLLKAGAWALGKGGCQVRDAFHIDWTQYMQWLIA